MKTVDVTQRSEKWFSARRGLPTCSRFDQIITPAEGKPSAQQKTLIAELIAESVLPPEEGLIRPSTSEMEYGMRLEGEARCAYELEHATGAMSEVGFMLHDSGLFGGSPDALVGDDGGVEIKCPNASTHVTYVCDGVLPLKYKCQVHGYLIVSGRKWWDFWSYARNFEPFLLRVTPDAFTEKLETELRRFCVRYNDVRKRFGLPPFPLDSITENVGAAKQ